MQFCFQKHKSGTWDPKDMFSAPSGHSEIALDTKVTNFLGISSADLVMTKFECNIFVVIFGYFFPTEHNKFLIEHFFSSCENLMSMKISKCDFK